MNKFNIGDQVFLFSLTSTGVYVSSFVISMMEKKPDGIFYGGFTPNGSFEHAAPEKALFKTRKDAYDFIMHQCEQQMKNPTG